MEITATTKYIKMSPTKARDLANEIKGLPVSDALFCTEFVLQESCHTNW